jgi:AcrR family transcriptional regulator
MTQANEVSQKKEDRRVRRTKKLLTQALTQLLQEKQINEITVKELTDLADMNRGTFYLYYKDIFDMLEKIEDGLFEALEEIVFLHEHDDVSQQTKPILLDLFRFIEDNQEMCRVLLSPHGDMNFLHRLNEVVREKCLQMWPNKEDKNDATFEYHYSFVVYGCVGVFRAWLNSECQEPAEKMAEMADAMIRRGSLSIA